MDLLSVRKQFIQLSGHYDLVVDTVDFEDNGADFFLNAGQRWLDRKTELSVAIQKANCIAAIGSIGVTFQWCRSIQQVWVIDVTNSERTLLEKVAHADLRQYYYGVPTVDITQGTPLYYCPGFFGQHPNNPLTVTNYLGFADVKGILPNEEVFDGILFGPPCLTEMMIEIFGKFYSPQLTENSSTSFWTVSHPETLIMAACRMVEVFHRNSEGVKDWEFAAMSQLTDMDKDLADEENVDSGVMEG